MHSDPRLRLKTGVFAIIVIFSNAFGNFSLKWGLDHRPASPVLSPANFLDAIFSPWVLVGTSLLILWLLSRMVLLSWADLSYVLPVTAFGYVASVVIGRFFLKEQITPARWLGTLLIVAGTMLVGLGSPHARGDL